MRTRPTLPLLVGFAVCAALAPAAHKDLLFHASFDHGVEADFAKGDKRLHSATSYKKREDARAGLHHPDIEVAKGAGRFGDALRFLKKNERAVYYPAAGNVNFANGNWQGTISFWLSLDPETDLAPGFCDPLQVTDADYNDGAIWVDFTKDDKPRHFRLGVFGDLDKWNPGNVPPDKNPAFMQRLVVVRKTPFARGKWTHVAIAHESLGSGHGRATLYLNGELMGTTEQIREPFTWDMARSALRLGVNYVGLFDELSVYSRPFTAAQVKAIYQGKQVSTK